MKQRCNLMFGYIFRFIFLIILFVLLSVSIKTLVKKKTTKKSKIINVVSIFICLIIFLLSVISTDIKKPSINSNISENLSFVISQCLPETDSTQIYNIYEFDCEGYYGTIAVSKMENNDIKNILDNEKYELKIEDGTSITFGSHVACVRDFWGLPNCCIGTITLFQDNVRVFIKYTYKDKKVFGPIKYLTFTQYFYKDIIDIKEISSSIIYDSLVVVDNSEPIRGQFCD